MHPIAMLLAVGLQGPLPAPSPTYAFVNGQWFTGSAFEQRTMYSVDGMLRRDRPTRVDSTIDLGGGFVLPGFGEAHNHDLHLAGRIDAEIGKYLDQGVYYVMVQGNLSRFLPEVLPRLNSPSSVDVAFARAMLASPLSHTVELYGRLVRNGVYPGVTPEELEGEGYFVIATDDQLMEKWPSVLRGQPDFIKVMIEYSEEYDLRKADRRFFGRSGLDPKLVPSIVERAHAVGLRVSAHIETAHDFRVAVESGVDIIAHLPGYQIPVGDDVSRYAIADDDARLAAARGTAVVTTTLLAVNMARGDTAQLRRVRENQVSNLRLLADRGVRLVIGSDSYASSSLEEVLNLETLGVFDRGALLRMWAETTPQTIFPDRRIGRLDDAYEASFVVLEEDPLVDLQHLWSITLGLKQGELLTARSGGSR